MAGKTGTCQVDYTTDSVQYISSFVGYFPADKPQYSCIVVIHRPDKTKGYYGATVAAPVFKTIAKKIFNDIPKEVALERSRLTELIKNTNSSKELSVPNLTGLSEKEVLKKTQELGLKVLFRGTGTVKEQRPEAGTKMNTQQQIILKLS